LEGKVSPSLDFVDAPGVELVLVFDDGRRVELRGLNGRLIRELWHDNIPIGVADFDDRLERFVGRTTVGEGFRWTLGSPRKPLGLPIAWVMDLVLDSRGQRIGATNPTTREFRIMSFDTGETLGVRPCPQDVFCSGMRFDRQDPSVIWFRRRDFDGFVRVDFVRGTSTRVYGNQASTVRWAAVGSWDVNSTHCPSTGEDLVPTGTSLDIRSSGGSVRRLVTSTGYHEAVFGDRFPPIVTAAFVDGCRYALFLFGGKTYVVDVHTGQMAQVPGAILAVRSETAVENFVPHH
jgi:hypothetical protein